MQPCPRITYTLAMPAPHTHLFHVQLTITNLARTSLDLVLPAWTPGSYMIRDYARHIQSFAAEADGLPLPWHKTAKDTWHVTTHEQAQVHVCYQVYANDLTVRTSHLDGTHGYANGATLFLYVAGCTAEPLALAVHPAPGWHVTTALDRDPADPTRWLARDYDELIDCPLECGTHRLSTFSVDDIPHQIALWGQGNEDPARIVADTQRIVETQRDLFGGLPYPHYTFILHLADRWGGLEHRNSVTNLVDRWTFGTPQGYQRFLELQSHELFHVWNVKRIRPAVLGPFDYQRENYTRLLWAMEGITSYYDRLLLVRAGLLAQTRYFELLAEDIVRLHSTPGRHLHSLEESSFDAWIKLYRRDEHTDNSSVSYYLKGGLVIWLLDMELRQRSNGARSFDDVLRYLHATYPPEAPGIPEAGAYLAAVEEIGGYADGVYRAFFARYITGTDELDYDAALDAVGLRATWSHTRSGPDSGAPGWLGLRCTRKEGRTLVASARADGPAFAAGISANDELLALDGWRVDEHSLLTRLAERTPGTLVTLTLFRRNELLQVPVTLAAAPYDSLRIAPLATPTARQQRLLHGWLAASSATGEHSRGTHGR